MNGQTDRIRQGIFASLVGIVCNLLLSAGKLACGLIFGLVSVTADGVNNLNDCLGGAVQLVSFSIAGKPADEEHPFGHRRAESVAAVITGMFILFTAVELLRESLGSVLAGELCSAPAVVFALEGVSIAVKAGMFLFYRNRAKKIGSDALGAGALDSLCDCAATFAVLAGMALSRFGIAADGWTGIAVSLFIVWQGARVLKEASSKLLGRAPDPELLKKLKEILSSCKESLGYHDLRVFTYGNGISFATVHVEMDATLPSLAAHAVLDGLESRAEAETGVLLTTHLDPVDLADGDAEALKREMSACSKKITEGIELHDFRLVRGAKTTVIFEAGVPFSCKLKDGEIRAKLTEELLCLGDYKPVITIERE